MTLENVDDSDDSLKQNTPEILGEFFFFFHSVNFLLRSFEKFQTTKFMIFHSLCSLNEFKDWTISKKTRKSHFQKRAVFFKFYDIENSCQVRRIDKYLKFSYEERIKLKIYKSMTGPEKQQNLISIFFG